MTVVQPERYAGDLWRHPDQRPASPDIYYEPAIAEQTNRSGKVTRPGRDACVRLTGPLSGQLCCDPERLRYEAHRLLDAADTLDAMLGVERPVDEALEQLQLDLDVTPAMRAGEQRIFQCAHCGTIIVAPGSRRPTAACPACEHHDGWWEQQLPVAGLRERVA